MKLKIGKLYSCEEYFLMLYPDKDTAAEGAVSADADRGAAARTAVYWTNSLLKPVSYLEKSIPILVLNAATSRFYEVLGGDRKGWIAYKDWLNIKEIA